MNTNNELRSKNMARRSFLHGVATMGGALLTTAAVAPAYAANAHVAASPNPIFQTDAMTAEELVAEIRAELQAIDEQIQQHPYLAALQKKESFAGRAQGISRPRISHSAK